MIFVTTYKVKPFIPREESRELMKEFADAGPAPGTIAHYVATDGSGGIVIVDSDDEVEGYRNQLRYSRWLEFNTKVMLTVEDAVPHLMEALA